MAEAIVSAKSHVPKKQWRKLYQWSVGAIELQHSPKQRCTSKVKVEHCEPTMSHDSSMNVIVSMIIAPQEQAIVIPINRWQWNI